MPTVVFSITSSATTHALFIIPGGVPHTGAFVPLKKKGDARVGGLKLPSGAHTVLITLKGGAPKSAWTLTTTIDDNDPIEVKGKLNKEGDGGYVGTLDVV